MDNQNEVSVQPLAPTPIVAPPQPQQYVAASQQKPKGKGKKVLLILFFILLLGGIGFLGYQYKVTNDNLKKQSQKLAEAYTTIGQFQKIIDVNKAEKDFIAKNNTASLSRQSCNGKPLLMSDVHLTDRFAVYRYLCAGTSLPIQIAALKKLPDGSYEFTYGSGSGQANNLPGYIYDEDPTFYAIYGVTRF